HSISASWSGSTCSRISTPSGTLIASGMPGADVRAMAVALALGAILIARTASAAEHVPDASLLLDLDLLSQAEPQERDLMRRMTVVERLRLLELLRFLDSRPGERRLPADERHHRCCAGWAARP